MRAHRDDICFVPATELARLYRARKVSPLEVMQAVLARIDAVNPTVNAYVTVARESALAGARRATRLLSRKSSTLPPLHGVPVSIKDLFATKGIRSTWGSLIYKDHVPDADDLVVQRLKAAGAIVVGKTNTPEFGAGGNTFNAVFGATRNPWNPALTCGGSSGGAAVAVATGMGPIAQGSDLGNSLRTPLMLAAMAGPDDRVPLSYDVDTSQFTRAVKAPSIKGRKVAWTPDLDGLIPVDDEVRRVAHHAVRAFRGLGARVETACPDFSEVPDIIQGTRALTMVALHADRLPKWREHMQKELVRDTEHGLGLTTRDITRGEVLRSALWQRVRTFMATRDLLVLPTVAVPPFPVEQPYLTQINSTPLDHYYQWFSLMYAITVTGLPAISVPCGFTRSGLPVGLQIVGRRHQEAAVLRAAAAFEAAVPWAAHPPPMVSELATGTAPPLGRPETRSSSTRRD